MASDYSSLHPASSSLLSNSTHLSVIKPFLFFFNTSNLSSFCLSCGLFHPPPPLTRSSPTSSFSSSLPYHHQQAQYPLPFMQSPLLHPSIPSLDLLQHQAFPLLFPITTSKLIILLPSTPFPSPFPPLPLTRPSKLTPLLRHRPLPSPDILQHPSFSSSLPHHHQQAHYPPVIHRPLPSLDPVHNSHLSSPTVPSRHQTQLSQAAPVTGGIGMFLLQKMGWKHGEGLGKNNEGKKEPLMLDVKVDRKGLSTAVENPQKKAQIVTMPRAKDLSNKHPVSALMELCNRRKWGPPCFTVVDESGPDHKKNFLFKVKVNNIEYQPAVPSSNKKTAKAECAAVCLQELGLIPRDAPLNI